MTNLKHIGRFVKNKRKCIVAYRTLPGDAYNCLVIPTEAVQDSYHDTLISLVESNAAQNSFEFAEVLARNHFTDGSVMLASLHKQGKLVKIPTSEVEMIPNFQTTIRLDELNMMIAEQKGVAVNDLALTETAKDPNVEVQDIAQVNEVPVTNTDSEVIETQTIEPVLTTEQRATKLRGEADKLSKQAAELRRQAEELVPTKRNASKKTK